MLQQCFTYFSSIFSQLFLILKSVKLSKVKIARNQGQELNQFSAVMEQYNNRIICNNHTDKI